VTKCTEQIVRDVKNVKWRQLH